MVLATLTWKDVAQYYGGTSTIFSKEPTSDSSKIPLTVFLGIDERKSLAEGDAAKKTQQSLPKAGDTGYNPEGEPYFALDTANHPELAEKAKELCGGEDNAIFVDLRAELLSVDFETTGVIAEARALVDWNKRSKPTSHAAANSAENSVCYRQILPRLREPDCTCVGWMEARLSARSATERARTTTLRVQERHPQFRISTHRPRRHHGSAVC